MAQRAGGEELMEAVSRHDVRAVQQCLERGADANFKSHEDEPDGYLQPTTPLRMVLFAISDSLLEEAGLSDFAEIAKLLLRHGADPKPAMAMAERRYGRYDPGAPSSLFMDVWHIVARGDAGRG